jgi:hypothetical protein
MFLRITDDRQSKQLSNPKAPHTRTVSPSDRPDRQNFTVWPLIVFPHTRADKPAGFMATVLQPMSPSAVRLCF